MLSIEKIDHIGIRVKDKGRSIPFYQSLGFKLIDDIGFEKGHPVIMRSDSGIVLNLLGPSTDDTPENILMDVTSKHTGYTHMALKVESISDAKEFMIEKGYKITGEFEFKDLKAFFIRDPDMNVIEFDEYPESEPQTRPPTDDDHKGS